jgi:hypothetical protein
VTKRIARVGSGLVALTSLLASPACSSDDTRGERAPGAGGLHGDSGRSAPSGGGPSSSGALGGGSGGAANSGGATSPGSGGKATAGGAGRGGAGGTRPLADGGGGAAEGGPGACDTGVDGIEVAPVDLDAFPAYGIDRCTLVYVGTTGDLKRKDLASGAELLLAAAAEMPRRPTIAGPIMAWEATEAGKSVVRVRSNETTTTVAGQFDHAGEPRATTDAVVFTGWLSVDDEGDTDVFVWRAASGRVELVLGGAGQQRFADISPASVAVSDFSEDPAGRYAGDGTSLADVVLIDRATGKQVKRQLPGKQAFPMLGSSESLVYLEWLEVHPVPKLQQYTIAAVPISTPSADAREIAQVQSFDAVRPTAGSGHVEWVSRGSATTSIFRAALDGTGTVVPLELPGIAVAHAPVSTAGLTVLAVRQMQTSAPHLELITW